MWRVAICQTTNYITASEIGTRYAHTQTHTHIQYYHCYLKLFKKWRERYENSPGTRKRLIFFSYRSSGEAAFTYELTNG